MMNFIHSNILNSEVRIQGDSKCIHISITPTNPFTTILLGMLFDNQNVFVQFL